MTSFVIRIRLIFPAPFLMPHQDGATSTRLSASREEAENLPNQTDVEVYFR